MKTISEKTTAAGKRRVVVELDGGETLMAVRNNAYYRLGEPIQDVVPGHVISDAGRAEWCCITQKWEA